MEKREGGAGWHKRVDAREALVTVLVEGTILLSTLENEHSKFDDLTRGQMAFETNPSLETNVGSPLANKFSS
ncbi:unnamed protein product [Ilex paraguariensis]|uniref:Uncharacterized protein n=1 Tax=Ilex paraguariensis TaxID=185542 RepID=A0ABC8QVD4_9AQUA